MSEPLRRLYRSVFRVGWPRTPKQRLSAMLSSLLLHLHPTRVRVHVLRPSYTLGLGLVSFFLFAVLTLTGLLLMLYYVPHTSAAYRSMLDLRYAVAFGPFLRNAHRWAAHGMVAVVFLHMCRVFFTGAYKPPRELNWVVGVLLLLLTLALSFTGYLLPWDQLAFWAITVGTSIVAYFPLLGPQVRYLLLGGYEIGQAALLRFYVLHCLILPLAMAGLVALHFWRVRKDGGLSAPAHASERRVLAWPHLVFRELLVLVVVLVLVNAFAVAVNAPLEDVADATRTPNPAKAPWYFLGLQELVHYGAILGGVVVPTTLVLALLLLPYLDTDPRGIGVWFSPDRRLANTVFACLALAVVAVTVIGTFFRGPNWAWVLPWAH
ncbi:MAG TPA: cytochrome b N-terminal domain-containing protein [Vicinamibacteria bacterium]|nr:cytochrome b N-terminal domain-containing protein [Vicinamibacteria bacterium]